MPHLTIVFAALAVSRWIEHQTGWSIRKLIKTARRYRTVQIHLPEAFLRTRFPASFVPRLIAPRQRRCSPDGNAFTGSLAVPALCSVPGSCSK